MTHWIWYFVNADLDFLIRFMDFGQRFWNSRQTIPLWHGLSKKDSQYCMLHIQTNHFMLSNFQFFFCLCLSFLSTFSIIIQHIFTLDYSSFWRIPTSKKTRNDCSRTRDDTTYNIHIPKVYRTEDQECLRKNEIKKTQKWMIDEINEIHCEVWNVSVGFILSLFFLFHSSIFVRFRFFELVLTRRIWRYFQGLMLYKCEWIHLTGCNLCA